MNALPPPQDTRKLHKGRILSSSTPLTMPCARLPHMQSHKASLLKHVLLKRARSQHGQPPRLADLEDTSHCSIELENQDHEVAGNRQPYTAARRRRTQLPGAQRVIRTRIEEIKQHMQSLYLNARFLRNAAVLRRCPVPYDSNPKAYFSRQLRSLVLYHDRHISDWETELQTLLTAIGAPSWNKAYWRNNLNLVFDSILVVIEAM
ncbi:hypothetical protein R3P38DRAFT_2905318 [Favolaschia claudopus]|uniref:Uncharacterized protein n=1 Tax=Favolaschia claudopus TaxID=2862362 RepID=A0AAW0CHA0_9AGAR